MNALGLCLPRFKGSPLIGKISGGPLALSCFLIDLVSTAFALSARNCVLSTNRVHLQAIFQESMSCSTLILRNTLL